MDSSIVHILTFSSQNHAIFDDSTIVRDQDIQGVWTGECYEDPELTLVVLAGCPDGVDPASVLGSTPEQQQRTKVSIAALTECLNAPVTEVATTSLKVDCDHTQAVSFIDAAMQTVLDADDCISAVWKTGVKEATFFVGWRFLQAHEKYHQKIFADPPDCIKKLPSIVDNSIVFHVAFRQIC